MMAAVLGGLALAVVRGRLAVAPAHAGHARQRPGLRGRAAGRRICGRASPRRRRRDRTGPEQPPTAADCRQRPASSHPSLSQFQGYQFSFRTDSRHVRLPVRRAAGAVRVPRRRIVRSGPSGAPAAWRPCSSGGPRRVRVLLGKLGALLLGVLTLRGAHQRGLDRRAVGHGPVTRRRRHITAGVRRRRSAIGDARALALALACAAAGFAIASYGRPPSAALGVAVGYIVVDEVVLRIVLSASGIARPQRFFLTSYVFAWLNKTMEYATVGGCRVVPFGGCQSATWSITIGQSAVLLGSVVVLLLAAGTYALHRNDVT